MCSANGVVHIFSCVVHTFRVYPTAGTHVSCVLQCRYTRFVCTPVGLRVIRVAGRARCHILGASGSQDVPRQSPGETYKGTPFVRRSREALPSPRSAPKTDFAARASCRCCGDPLLLRIRISAIGKAEYFFTCFRIASINACRSNFIFH